MTPCLVFRFPRFMHPPTMGAMPDTPDERLFAEALLSGRHTLEQLQAEFAELYDEARDLAGLTTDELRELDGVKVIPAPGVTEYLAAEEDGVSDAVLDAAEIATERHYGLAEPFYVTSFREGLPGRRRVRYFYLGVE